MEPILVYLAIAVCIFYTAIKEDIYNRKIANGFKPDAKDGDKDGLLQEGTKWERKVK